MNKTLSWIAFLVSLLALVVSGWLLLSTPRDTQNITEPTASTSQNKADAVTPEPVTIETATAGTNSKNGIVIDTPLNGATVGRTFTLSGTGPTKYIGMSPSIYIDGETLYYWDKAARGSPSTTGEFSGVMQADGSFSLEVDLNGDEVVQDRSNSPAAGTMSSLSEGNHSFTIKWDPRLLGTTEGPTLTLYVQ
jgi:hypothetical protein